MYFFLPFLFPSPFPPSSLPSLSPSIYSFLFVCLFCLKSNKWWWLPAMCQAGHFAMGGQNQWDRVVRTWRHTGTTWRRRSAGHPILCGDLCNHFQSTPDFLWHQLLEALGAPFGLRTPLLTVRIATKESAGSVLTHLSNGVTCSADNLTRDFEEDCSNGLQPPKDGHFLFSP